MFFAALISAAIATPSPADIRNIDLSKSIAAKVGDRIWPGWSKTPWAIDLLTGHGSALIGVSLAKPPAFPPALEATFPLDNGVETIVIGEPAFTQSKDPTRWSVVLLHEHFHAWQYDHPGYAAKIQSLGLAPKHAANAMWMLNYPFPYADPRVDALYATLAHAVARAVEARGTAAFAADFARYRSARRAFRAAIGAKDYRYFAFQCWQEGVARYTEITVARAAVEAHRADPSFLSDVTSTRLARDSAHTYATTMRELASARLQTDQRVAFYALGAGEALLLDRVRPGWRRDYFGTHADVSELFGP